MADFKTELSKIAASYQATNITVTETPKVKITRRSQLKAMWVQEDAKPDTKGQDHKVMWRGHVGLIALGIVIACATTYLYGPLVHLAPAIATAPAFIQEAFDRIFKF